MGSRRKTRYELQKHKREKGKISISRYFQKFKDGEKVVIKIDPSVQKGVFHPRFHGKAGVVKGKKGACYEVLVKDFKKQKTILVHPIHIRKV
ncbi:50S ribosomal protein L21e [Candidatus Woesearchaeota archaeon RBG_13_36_6]|nr:MAG: 50S ribosomal protein L21e [Candidatus Woesearchaeota archaeon RBG_13_36_6]